MVNVVWLQKWSQTIALHYKSTCMSRLQGEYSDIDQAELDDRTASAHNETKRTQLQVNLLTLVLQAWCEHTDAVVPLWSSSVPKPP